MKCPHCRKGILKKVKSDEPWHDDYLICKICQSTYNINDPSLKSDPNSTEAVLGYPRDRIVEHLKASGFSDEAANHVIEGKKSRAIGMRNKKG